MGAHQKEPVGEQSKEEEENGDIQSSLQRPLKFDLLVQRESVGFGHWEAKRDCKFSSLFHRIL